MLSPPLIFQTPTHVPLLVRSQYRSRSSLLENSSPSSSSNGVRPTMISKNVTPRDHTSDLRVSCLWPRARSGERYSGVPYARFDSNGTVGVFGVGDGEEAIEAPGIEKDPGVDGEPSLRSYFSANPKSTRTGCSDRERSMLAGLISL